MTPSPPQVGHLLPKSHYDMKGFAYRELEVLLDLVDDLVEHIDPVGADLKRLLMIEKLLKMRAAALEGDVGGKDKAGLDLEVE